MAERPILFSAAMVRAIFANTKTQTRRVAKGVVALHAHTKEPLAKLDSAGPRVRCPYGAPGDRLWAKESWQYADWTEDGEPWVRFAADGAKRLCMRIPIEWADRITDTWAALSIGRAIGEPAADRRWRPSIHMPRWASRITLEVTEVRVERLQDISEADARAEGAPPSHPSIDRVSREYGYADFPRSWYAQLWDEINGPGSWEANPWVWVVGFRRVEATDA